MQVWKLITVYILSELLYKFRRLTSASCKETFVLLFCKNRVIKLKTAVVDWNISDLSITLMFSFKNAGKNSAAVVSPVK